MITEQLLCFEKSDEYERNQCVQLCHRLLWGSLDNQGYFLLATKINWDILRVCMDRKFHDHTVHIVPLFSCYLDFANQFEV